jgi:hypothetical protein
MTRKVAIVLSLAACLLVGACDTEKVELQKSPCVGLDDSPCGPKRSLTGNA